MELVLQLALFLLLILLASFARSRLVYELSASSLILFDNRNLGKALYALVTLPGTILHELSHWLVAELLGVRTGQIKLWPSFSDDKVVEQQLGSVMTARSDPFRGFLIGLAPLFTGLATLLLLGYLLDIWWGLVPVWQLALVVYGLVVVGNSMLISRADRRFLPLVVIITVLVFVVLYLAGVKPAPATLSALTPVMIRINQVLGLTILLNLAIIGGSGAIRLVLERLTGRRVVQKRKLRI